MNKGSHSVLSFSLSALLCSTSFVAATDVALAGSSFRPPRSGAPGNREAGAARSDTCASTASSNGLTALLPSSNLGLTTRAYPTFFAYIPPNNAKQAEFRLLEEGTNQPVFIGQIPMSQAATANSAYQYKASVLSMSLPKSAVPQGLQVGKSYMWALMVVCNPKNRAEDIVVTGVVQRVGDDYIKTLDPKIKQNLNRINQASPQEKLAIYGAAGIWNDMLADTAALMQKNPATYGKDWKDLLSDQGLGAIATVPIVEVNLKPIRP